MALKCTPDPGDYVVLNIYTISIVHCILSKALNARSQPLTTKQMISLRQTSEKKKNELLR